MAHAGRERLLADLRQRIDGLGQRKAGRAGVLPFGVPALDAHLPGGGLALGGLHEIMEEGEHGALAALFVAAFLARRPGPVLWCLARRDLFAPALACVGLHPDRVLYAETLREAQVLAAMEEGLRHAGLAGVVGETGRLGLTASRRLLLAAEDSGVPAFAVRRTRAEPEPNAVLTRWRIAPAPSGEASIPGLGRARWRVELLRCRGADPRAWILSGPDAQGRLAPPPDLADRPRAPERRRAAAG
ncbi:ImuA family protein [Salinarimonas soli]|uniref:Damage-inducible mutagenesis protein n=1 Tax=Salinarimonas soli TaxID=1638099 RepID=A0A5B2V4R7_9HYPH|nr:damage-inducible mutagenesis protein [Salinarimonas soli]KAA2233139.1 damage-inducible mutagenesis protein [Salinarimonas soli]